MPRDIVSCLRRWHWVLCERIIPLLVISIVRMCEKLKSKPIRSLERLGKDFEYKTMTVDNKILVHTYHPVVLTNTVPASERIASACMYMAYMRWNVTHWTSMCAASMQRTMWKTRKTCFGGSSKRNVICLLNIFIIKEKGLLHVLYI